jgi:cytochrome c5
MRSFPSLVLLLLLSWTVAAEQAGYYGYGKTATPHEIAGWDIDVRPDGTGLPPGTGSVEDGEWIYEDQCAECHGSFGEGVGRYPAISGGEGTLTDARPHKSVGSFWPYTSTLWDYIHRAMPFMQPESLTDDEVYAVTAYVLYLNDIVSDDFVLTDQNLASTELPNRAGFKADDRPDTSNTRCMRDCKKPGTIKIASVVEPINTQSSVEEAPVAASKITAAGKAVYDQACGFCHNAGISGAPVPGDATWAARADKGRDLLVRNAINGYQGDKGVMPPKGGFGHLSDEAVGAAVGFMMEQSQ